MFGPSSEKRGKGTHPSPRKKKKRSYRPKKKRRQTQPVALERGEGNGLASKEKKGGREEREVKMGISF